MKRKLIVIAALIGMIAGSAATIDAKTAPKQDNGQYPWFITVAGGPQVYFSEYDRLIPFGDRISTNLEIGAGKWLAPFAGVRVMVSGCTINAATVNGAHGQGASFVPEGTSQRLKKQHLNFINLHADAMFNFSNIVMGDYKADRIYNCSPYIGIAMVSTWDNPKKTCLAGNVGLFNAFCVSRNFDINIDIRGLVVPDQFNGEKAGRSGEGLLSVSFGFTYNFR